LSEQSPSLVFQHSEPSQSAAILTLAYFAEKVEIDVWSPVVYRQPAHSGTLMGESGQKRMSLKYA